MKISKSLTEGSITSALFRLSIPIVVGNLLQTAYQITDTFWVGRLSTEAVAAVSLSFPVIFLLMAIGGGLPMAGTVLVAQYKGRGDEKSVNYVSAQTFMMVILTGAILSVIGYIIAEPTMALMGASPKVLPDATFFLQVTFLGYIFVFGYFVFESLMRGIGEVRIPVFIVLSTVLLNLILDPLFIFGWGPIPAMGVAGAAMATLCTQALATVIGCIVLFTGKYGIRIHLSDLRFDLSFMYKAFRIGLPSSLEQSMRALGMILMTMLVATFGTDIVAAYGIGVRLLIFVIIPALGFSLATSTLVGQNIGAGKIERAERTTFIGTALSFIVLTVIGLLMFAAARPLTVFFLPDGGVAIDLTVRFLRIIALSLGFISIQMVISGTFRGAGQTTTAMMIVLIEQWVLQFPLAYVLSKHTSLAHEGIWWSFIIGNVLGAGIVILWYRRGDWKRKSLIGEVKLQQQAADEVRIGEGSY